MMVAVCCGVGINLVDDDGSEGGSDTNLTPAGAGGAAFGTFGTGGYKTNAFAARSLLSTSNYNDFNMKANSVSGGGSVYSSAGGRGVAYASATLGASQVSKIRSFSSLSVWIKGIDLECAA
jgi:hypothetical protein